MLIMPVVCRPGAPSVAVMYTGELAMCAEESSVGGSNLRREHD